MISRIEGDLLAVHNGRVQLACGSITYELHIPGADEQRLGTMIGRSVTFHTLHYLESQGQGTAYVPRLVGFSSPEDRAFFELFTTVRGLGVRRALRALQLPFGVVAAAIAEKDVDLLTSLPEIGKRLAQTILAELQGKVDRFVEIKPFASTEAAEPGKIDLIRDAVGVLVQLGEQKLHARQLVDRALAADPALDSPDQVVAAAYRLKELP